MLLRMVYIMYMNISYY